MINLESFKKLDQIRLYFLQTFELGESNRIPASYIYSQQLHHKKLIFHPSVRVAFEVYIVFGCVAPLRWCCVECVIDNERDVREEQHHTYMWREQAIIEWSPRVISIVACCHSAKLCAYAARDFLSQQLVKFITFYTNPSLR